MIKKTIKILHLEDLATDAEQIEWVIRNANIDYNFDLILVDTELKYKKALFEFLPDIILSDHNLPGFTSMEALDILKNSGLKIPFILVTGTVSEEFAVTAMKNGADDYILKDRLQRLPEAIISAVKKFRLKKEYDQVELEIKKKEKQYTNIIKHLPANIALINKQGIIIDVNNSWKLFAEQNGFNGENYGIGSSYIETSRTKDNINKEDGNRIEEAISKILDNELETFSMIYPCPSPFKQRWFKVIASKENENKDSGVVLMHIDITEQKESEKLIRESEIKYRSFFENSMDGILLTATNGEIFAANPAACSVFKMTEFEICKAGRSGLLYAEDNQLKTLLEERKMAGKAKGELVFVRKDGSRFPAEVTSAIFKGAYGEEKTSIIFRDITERKLSEVNLINTSNALRKTLTDLEKIMAASLDVICAVDENGFFIKVSAASEAVFGYKPDELIGKQLINYVYPEDKEKTLKSASNVMRGINNTHFENRYVRKDGSIVYIEWSARWDEKDRIRYGIARDVTEKKRIEKVLEVERQRFHNLFLQAPSCVGILKGPNHEFKMANPLYLKLTGKEDIIGKTVEQVFPETIQQGFLQILDNVYNTGEPFSANEMLLRVDKNGDGTLVDIYTNFIYQAYEDEKGTIEGIFFFAVDVTEQVLSRKKIEESERKYRQIVETAQEGIWLINENNKTVFVNKKFSEIFGYSFAEMMSKTNYDLMDDEGKLVIEDKIKRRKNGISEEFEHIYISKDGKKIWAKVSASSIIDKEGNYVGALAMISDITERKKVQIEIEQKNEQLKNLTLHLHQIREEERTAISREIHDELGQQLTALKMDIDWVKHKQKNQDGAVISKLEEMLKMGDSLIGTIRRISSDLRPPIIDDLGLIAALEWKCYDFKKKTGVECKFNSLAKERKFDNDFSINVYRILQETLTNISRHAKANFVTVVVQEKEATLFLDIEDDGIGISNERVQNKKTLGIIGMHERAALLGGKLIIEGIKNKGTNTKLIIPIKNENSNS